MVLLNLVIQDLSTCFLVESQGSRDQHVISQLFSHILSWFLMLLMFVFVFFIYGVFLQYYLFGWDRRWKEHVRFSKSYFFSIVPPIIGQSFPNNSLVGGWEHGFYFPFHIWDVVLPIDELTFVIIFQDGYCTTNQFQYSPIIGHRSNSLVNLVSWRPWLKKMAWQGAFPWATPKKELKRYGEWWNIDRILEDIWYVYIYILIIYNVYG